MPSWGKSVKKVLNVIKKVLVWAVVIFAVGMMVFTLISVTAVGKNDRNIFGYRVYIVLSDSMSATDFDAGDLVVSKMVDPSTLKEGDIISYLSQNSESYGETITHKIRKLTRDANGERGFITYGTTTNTDDAIIVTYPYVLGQYKFRLPKLGSFFQFLKTTPGYIIFILVPFMVLILYQGIRSIILFKRYKKEQMSELEEEQQKIAEEREESERMLEELRRLKEELAKAQQGNAAPGAAAAAESTVTAAAETVTEATTAAANAASSAGNEVPKIELEDI